MRLTIAYTLIIVSHVPAQVVKAGDRRFPENKSKV